jgi:glycosyltransferase involved in cell wall biosynthesis
MPISVIIPAYKARKYLPDCLESIGKQTLQPSEVLVIDDASPEPIDDIVRDFSNRSGYPPIRLIKHEVNRGQAAGRNTGMKAASGDWLAFIDCDDMWVPNHLESVIATANESGADLVFCPAILFSSDPHDPSNYRLRPLTEDEIALRPISILNRCFIVISSSVIRAEALRMAGNFDEDPMMRGVEDLDLYMRMLRTGAKFHMDPEATLYYRKHPGSATETTGYLAKQSVHVTQTHIGSVEGSRSEKLYLLIHTRWRTAIQLWLIKSPDRVSWLLSAIRQSLWNPYQCVRWTYRFFRSLYRNSSRNL